MYYREHGKPHFHATYGEYEITVEIDTGNVTGEFPKRALNHVLEWNNLHKSELLANWEKLKTRNQPSKIQPLE
ncbi:MAG: DUF4160 domain-containing protein [Bacteroidetes bacterium]|nr:MAG: DUF4160 domain-containing protein [Bacteroidota bacterium]